MLVKTKQNEFHITYCLNVHKAENFDELKKVLIEFVVPLKKLLAPKEYFGLGIKFSVQLASELMNPTKLFSLCEILNSNKLYIFTANAYVYGKFHQKKIKEKIFNHCWFRGGNCGKARISYTLSTAYLLSRIGMLQDMQSDFLTISTISGTYKPRANSPYAKDKIAHNIIYTANELNKLFEKEGRKIVLCLEPEPLTTLETSNDVCDFYKNFLLKKATKKSEAIVREFVGICYDTCHQATIFEDPLDSIRRITKEGVKIFKTQISNAVKLQGSNPNAQSLIDGVFLHQVYSQEGKFYGDLNEKLIDKIKDQNLRIHYHIPFHLKEFNKMKTTQDFTRRAVRELVEKNICKHFEAEFYTLESIVKDTKDMIKYVANDLKYLKKVITSQK